MKRARVIHAIAAVLVGLAIASVMSGHARLAVAILCLVCLGLIISGEALRVTVTTTARKVKP